MKPNKKKLQFAVNKLKKKVIYEEEFILEKISDYRLSIFKTYKELIGEIGINELTAKPEMSFSGISSYYLHTIKNKKFKEKWDKKKNKLLEKQFSCKKCKKKWNKKDKIFPQLHHYKMKEKKAQAQREIEKRVYSLILKGNLTIEKGYKKFKGIERKLLNYYKSLKDTKLLCFPCHTEEEGLSENIEANKRARIERIQNQHITLDNF